MAKILIFCETQGNSLKTVALEMATKINQYPGHIVDAVFIGNVPAEATTQLAQRGVNKIFSLKSSLTSYSPEGYAKLISSLVKENGHDYCFAGATSMGKDFLPRASSALKAPLASDVTNFIFEGDTFFGTRPFFAGKCLAKVEFKTTGPKFISIRPNALGLEGVCKESSPNVEEKQISLDSLRAIVKEVVKGTSEKADLTEANIIVSGGRAMKNSDNFKILHELADVLGATVGASRAAVDSGYAAPAMQVGQTGKTVSPSLYIACGISGAIQHLAGMRTSKIIVAINSDPEAPIFTKADYGIVGDLFKVVPLLTEEFKKLLS